MWGLSLFFFNVNLFSSVTIETDRDGGIDIDNKDNTEIVVGGLSTYKDFTLSVLETAVGVIIFTSNYVFCVQHD